MKRILLGLACAGLVLLPFAARAESKLEIYGNADVSMDYVDRGTSSVARDASLNCNGTGGDCLNASPYVQMSSNLSYLGFRVTHDLGDSGLKALLQFETQVDVAATPNQKDGLGSRDSYIGLAGGFGAIKLGKSDTPYKKATARMDPFSATVGDYNSIMGNTGGDNRAEFDLRLPHALWWESAKMGGMNIAVMYAPGQNRSSTNQNAPEGEFFDGTQLCSGSAPHGSGTTPPCTDGSFGDAYSLSVSGDSGPLFWTVGYEVHNLANREGDDPNQATAAFGSNPTRGSLFCPTGDLTCMGAKDESAIKVGVQYKLPMTTLNFIYESMTRSLGNEPSTMDERSRTGMYLSAVQRLSEAGEGMFAWAHADATKGDPTLVDPTTGNFTTAVGSMPANSADMYALGYRHSLDKSFSIYAVYAVQNNGKGAHYDLGASGHGVPIVGRDGSNSCDGNDGCIPVNSTSGIEKATTISALSVGFKYSFSAPFDIGKM